MASAFTSTSSTAVDSGFYDCVARVCSDPRLANCPGVRNFTLPSVSVSIFYWKATHINSALHRQMTRQMHMVSHHSLRTLDAVKFDLRQAFKARLGKEISLHQFDARIAKPRHLLPRLDALHQGWLYSYR